MILNEISEYIVIDKIVEVDSEKYVHFLTHATDNLQVPPNWKSVIYTSKTIASLMLLTKCNIPARFFRKIALNDAMTITLPDGKSYKVTMFQHEGVLRNVMFHFEGSQRTALFTGSFITCRMIYLNRLFRLYVGRKIDYLFIDNSMASSAVEKPIEAACSTISEISRKFPDHQILINVPLFGYEDFIVSLAANLNVFVNRVQFLIFDKFNLSGLFESDAKAAKVIIQYETLCMEKVLRRFKRDNIITVQFVDNQEVHQKYFHQIGLFQIQWSPHPSLFQLYAFIEFVKPKQVKEIFSNGPKLPIVLKDNCEDPLDIQERFTNVLQEHCTSSHEFDSVIQPFSHLDDFATSTQKENISQPKEPQEELILTFSSLDINGAM